MLLSRRHMVAGSIAALAGGGLTLQPHPAHAAAAEPANLLVCVFLRGAVDALNMVVPYTERAYYDERPELAIRAPNTGRDAALRLDQHFALHPKLAPLLPLYRAKRLAVVHAAGSPHPTRSHFDAQDHMETGVLEPTKTRDGWANRCLAVRGGADHEPLRGIAMTSALPLALQGAVPTLAMRSIANFELRGGPRRREQLERGLAALYHDGSCPVSRVGNQALALIARVRSISERPYVPERGASYPDSGKTFRDLAQLIKADVPVELAWIDVPGFDTHVNQGGAQGLLANKLDQLARSLAAFERDLGPRMQRVVVLTLSEFGRTVRQNGTRGTDHGHGTALFVMGGTVRGGRVYGKWPGLEPEQRFEGRDLQVTTDFRDVVGEIVTHHMGLSDPGVLFPGHTSTPVGLLG